MRIHNCQLLNMTCRSESLTPLSCSFTVRVAAALNSSLIEILPVSFQKDNLMSVLGEVGIGFLFSDETGKLSIWLVSQLALGVNTILNCVFD